MLGSQLHFTLCIRYTLHEYSLTLVRVENLPFDHSTKNVLSVEFSLHLGSELIHGVRATSSKPQVSFTMKWNEEANFITKLRDLPKVRLHRRRLSR